MYNKLLNLLTNLSHYTPKNVFFTFIKEKSILLYNKLFVEDYFDNLYSKKEKANSNCTLQDTLIMKALPEESLTDTLATFSEGVVLKGMQHVLHVCDLEDRQVLITETFMNTEIDGELKPLYYVVTNQKLLNLKVLSDELVLKDLSETNLVYFNDLDDESSKERDLALVSLVHSFIENILDTLDIKDLDASIDNYLLDMMEDYHNNGGVYVNIGGKVYTIESKILTLAFARAVEPEPLSMESILGKEEEEDGEPLELVNIANSILPLEEVEMLKDKSVELLTGKTVTTDIYEVGGTSGETKHEVVEVIKDYNDSKPLD